MTGSRRQDADRAAHSSRQSATGPDQKSSTKTFPHAAHADKLAQPFDPWRFKAVFPDRWSAFLRAHYRNAEHVAHEYGVRYQTALNWWQGAHRPSGQAVAQAALTHGEGLRACLCREEAA